MLLIKLKILLELQNPLNQNLFIKSTYGDGISWVLAVAGPNSGSQEPTPRRVLRRGTM